MRLDDLQIERYSRQLVLPEIGVEGQERLLRAHVAVRGNGPAAERAVAYLAAAGVGRLTAAIALHAAVDPAHGDVRIAEPAPGETADAAIVVGDGGSAAADARHRHWIVGGRLGGAPPCPACADAALGPDAEAGAPFGMLRALLLGTIAATETVKALLAIGTPLRGRVLHVGPTGGDVTVDVVAPRPDCPACRPADPTGS